MPSPRINCGDRSLSAGISNPRQNAIGQTIQTVSTISASCPPREGERKLPKSQGHAFSQAGCSANDPKIRCQMLKITDLHDPPPKNHEKVGSGYPIQAMI